MEFSLQYNQMMASFVLPSGERAISRAQSSPFNENCAYKRWFTFGRMERNIPFEVPACMMWIVEYNMRNYQDYKLIIPIYITSYNETASGPETILKKLSRHNFDGHLLKIVTPKGETYYGCRGLILDKDFNILFMSTFQGILDENGITYNKRILYFNPLVFTDDTATVNKSLAKKALAFFLSRNVPLSSYGNFNFSEECSQNRISIVIDDVTSWIESPKKPKNPLNLNEDLNQFINQHISDILTQMRDDAREYF